MTLPLHQSSKANLQPEPKSSGCFILGDCTQGIWNFAARSEFINLMK